MDARIKPGHDEGNERVRTKEKIGGETPTDARRFCRGSGHGRASQRRGAHLSAFHRGSRPKESFIARDAASGQASWDVALIVAKRGLPAPSCPTVQRAPRPLVVVPRGLMPKAARARSASPPAGTALARAIRGVPPGPRPTRTRFD